MKTSYFVTTLVVALVLGVGISALILFGGPAATQTVPLKVTCPTSAVDQDGDCLSAATDYFPYDELR
ncbi:MAG: hypothetical protein V1895_02005 [Parcubacteria group bacterium]